METDTKPENDKVCSKCSESKSNDKFIKNRNICKECRNERSRANYNAAEVCSENIVESCKECITCNETKSLCDFVKKLNVCKDCNNLRRRSKYQNDEEHRLKMIRVASEFKHNKVIERQKTKLEEIGEDNKKCSICFTIKNKCRFRYNRLKCRDCERDDPVEKFKRTVRSRIYIGLKQRKTMHTISYLGCSSADYFQWMLTYDERYTIENRGTEWHIDHVIPLSHFNLEDEDEQKIAFNWRNTMPLNAKENLSKNNKILPLQIEQHVKYLSDYHKDKKLELPQVFIDLFAKHLVDGKPPKLSLPL